MLKLLNLLIIVSFSSLIVYYINLFQHPDPDFCDSNLNYDRGSGYHNKGRKVFFSILKEIMRTYRRLEVLFYKSLGYVNVKV